MADVPRSIKLNTPGGIRICWHDGHEALYSHAYLRRKCPCASCREAPPRIQAEDDPFRILGEAPIRAVKAVPVGRYAVQFQWNDRHDSGIYSFAYLREICPCETCRTGSS